jgi:twinkle protein
MIDAGQIKTQLAARAESVARALFPNGKRVGQEWCVGSTAGEPGQSLKVHLSGEKAGLWADFAAGKSGDLLDLYCAVRGVALNEALTWAKNFLGIHEPQLQRASKFAETPVEYRKPQVKNLTMPRNAVLDYLTRERGLSAETIKAFQVGAQTEHSFAAKSGRHSCPAVVFPFKAAASGELKFVKYLGTERPDGKKLIDAEAGCEPILFGWQAFPANARAVVIVEGEINAMTWHQYGIPAVATPFGAGKDSKHRWIASEWEQLQRFEVIYLNFDQDAPGREAVADLIERLGRHRCRVVPEMPDGHKDVNDCLRAGMSAEQMRALIEESDSCDPDELRSAVAFTDQVIEQFYPDEGTHTGVAVPLAGFGDKFRFRLGEMTIVTGYRGHGKTEAINLIMNSALAHGERGLIASLEMKAPVLLKRAVRQLTAQRLPSREYIRQVMTWYFDRLWLFDHVGRVTADKIFEVFEYAWRRYGVTFFVIDSLMKCGIRGDDLDGQDAFADRAANFAKQFNAHVLLVAHGRKDGTEENPPDNNGVKGSGGITDQADNVLAIWRNKARERAQAKVSIGEPLTREEQGALDGADGAWVVQKQREGEGELPFMPFWFDPDSKQMLSRGQAVQVFVPFLQEGHEYAFTPEF